MTDERGRWRYPGAEIRVYDSSNRRLLGSRLLDTGGGYCAQGASPAHFGIPAGTERVDVRVTVLGAAGRRISERRGIDPFATPGQPLDVRVPQ